MATRIHHLGLTVRPTLRRGAQRRRGGSTMKKMSSGVTIGSSRAARASVISSDLEMTDARMATVGEKLLSADIK